MGSNLHVQAGVLTSGDCARKEVQRVRPEHCRIDAGESIPTLQPRAAKESTCDMHRPADPATTWPRSLADMRKASYRAWSHQAPGTWEWRPLNAISEATA